MRIDSRDLMTKNKEQLREWYAQIPCTESIIELHLTQRFLKLLPEHVACLPKHITTVAVFGEYTEGLIDVSDADDQMPIMVSVSEIPHTVSKCLKYLPHSVHTLNLNFSYQAENQHPERLNELRDIVRHLPASIERFDVSGTDLYKSDDKEVMKLFASLPSSVTSLGFKLHRLELISAVVSSLHPSLKELSLDGCPIGSTKNNSVQAFNALCAALQPSVKKLSLRSTQLSALSILHSIPLFTKLHQGLEELDISDNGLGQMSKEALSKLFASMPAGLRILGCASNVSTPSSHTTYTKFFQALHSAPAALSEFNFSGNGLTQCKEFSFSSTTLPATVTSLSLFEPGMRDAHCASLLTNMPAHINTLSFKGQGALLRSKIGVLQPFFAHVPKTVTTLDCSNTGLHQWSEEQLSELGAAVPPQVRRLILKQNHLAYSSLAVFNALCTTLSPAIVEVDLSENGLARLPVAQAYARLSLLPETVRCSWDNHQLYTKTKGAFIPLPLLPRHSATAQPMPAPAQQTLSVRNNTDQRIQVYLAKACSRIQSVLAVANQVDLSHCDLHLIHSLGDWKALMDMMPQHIHSLNMRGNQFQDKKVFALVHLLLGNIPKRIIHLDLSEHGFEYLSAEQLKHLFSTLESHVRFVSLIPGELISPAQQIAKRTWPGSYTALTQDKATVLQQSRVLLDDYTKSDSSFLRFLFGHWNRTHVVEVQRIVDFMDKGLITKPREVLDALEHIKTSNKAGSLSKRLCFLHDLSHRNAVSQNTALLASRAAKDEEIELRALSK